VSTAIEAAIIDRTDVPVYPRITEKETVAKSTTRSADDSR